MHLMRDSGPYGYGKRVAVATFVLGVLMSVCCAVSADEIATQDLSEELLLFFPQREKEQVLVSKLFTDYQERDEQARRSRIDQLAELGGTPAILQLSRLAWFEQNESLAKHAAWP